MANEKNKKSIKPKPEKVEDEDDATQEPPQWNFDEEIVTLMIRNAN